MGMEAVRKTQLVIAAIEEVGARGSLDVTVSQIAKRAGVSPALAFHYFGDKTQIFLGAMRHILRAYGGEVRQLLKQSDAPKERLDAILRGSFAPSNFERHVISAWLIFYVTALNLPEAARLLGIYKRRLRSNLLADLRPLAGDRAEAVADGLGAMIDGIYIRQALGAADPEAALRQARDYLDRALRE